MGFALQFTCMDCFLSLGRLIQARVDFVCYWECGSAILWIMVCFLSLECLIQVRVKRDNFPGVPCVFHGFSA